MNIGLTEIIIIVVLAVVLFGVVWAYKNRGSKRTSSNKPTDTSAPTQK